jgi:hypothetical protein
LPELGREGIQRARRALTTRGLIALNIEITIHPLRFWEMPMHTHRRSWNSGVRQITCLALLLPVLLSTCLRQSLADDTEQSALERDPHGWTDLLKQAGPKLEGWVRGPVPAEGKLNPSSQWSLDEATGHLVCEGNGGHEWLRWDHELGDFIYHVEWRFTPVPGKKNYNSGVYARNSIDAKIWHQAQTGDGSGGHIFGNSEVGGALKRFNLSKRGTASRVKPAGEWNTFEITCRGKEMTLWVNGAVTTRWPECEVPRGYVGLEAEGYRIEFRNVKLKMLDAANSGKGNP